MRVLVACEFSGIVTQAFWNQGHDVWSCDLLPAERMLNRHVQCDVRKLLNTREKWDLMIAHPPCQYLAVSGARWFKGTEEKQKQAIEFVTELMNAPIEKIAIENPIGVLSTHIRKPDQIIHPWQFGHGETKATCLWLKNLPKLNPTKLVEGREGRVWKESPGPDRWKRRSRTYPGIAKAMVEQWGRLVPILGGKPEGS